MSDYTSHLEVEYDRVLHPEKFEKSKNTIDIRPLRPVRPEDIITIDLIGYLRQRYPMTHPVPGSQTEAEIWYESGKQGLIDDLESLAKEFEAKRRGA